MGGEEFSEISFPKFLGVIVVFLGSWNFLVVFATDRLFLPTVSGPVHQFYVASSSCDRSKKVKVCLFWPETIFGFITILRFFNFRSYVANSNFWRKTSTYFSGPLRFNVIIFCMWTLGFNYIFIGTCGEVSFVVISTEKFFIFSCAILSIRHRYKRKKYFFHMD